MNEHDSSAPGSIVPASAPLATTSATSIARAVAFLVAIAILCLPALWNGMPILFDDVGGYLDRWPSHELGNGRSAVYGLLLWPTRSTWWIPVILLQSLVTVWVIDRALAVFGFRRSPWTIAGVIAAIAATSGAALFTSQVMPDAWTVPAVLSLHLLAWHAERLNGPERAAMVGIVAFAGASHMLTLGVLAGLSLVYSAAWLLRRRLPVAPGSLLLANAGWGGLPLLLITNLLVTGQFALTPGGKVFLFARLIESGIVGKVLDQECPRADWQLCQWRSELPEDMNSFLWSSDSPLYKMGGWDDPRVQQEITAITRRSLVAHPIDHITSVAVASAKQFVHLGTRYNLSPLSAWHTQWKLEQYAPWLVAPYLASPQQRGEADLTRWSKWVVVPVSLVAIFALPLIAVWAWRYQRYRAAMLPAMVFVALLGNALICGIWSSVHDRYQGRLAWLAPLAVGLTFAAVRRRARAEPVAAA